MAAKFKSYDFMKEMLTYLRQEMEQSDDIRYIISTRDNLITTMLTMPEADTRILPNLFPLTGEHATTTEIVEGNPSGRTLGALEQYCIDYIDSRQLSDLDPETLTEEAQRLAKLLLATVTEMAIAILMVGMAEVKLLKRTPTEERLELVKKLHKGYTLPYHPFDRKFSMVVNYVTCSGGFGDLTLKFLDDENWPKLRSETGKHIIVDSITTNGITTNGISWEDLPVFIKNDILGNGDR